MAKKITLGAADKNFFHQKSSKKIGNLFPTHPIVAQLKFLRPVGQTLRGRSIISP